MGLFLSGLFVTTGGWTNLPRYFWVVVEYSGFRPILLVDFEAWMTIKLLEPVFKIVKNYKMIKIDQDFDIFDKDRIENY